MEWHWWYLVFLPVLWFLAGELQARTKTSSFELHVPLPVSGGFSWIPFVILFPRGDDFDARDRDHEVAHENQRERHGYTKWTWRYITDGWWTTIYEAEAYRYNACGFLKDHGYVTVVNHMMKVFYENNLYWFWPWLDRPERSRVRERFEREIQHQCPDQVPEHAAL